MTSENGTSDVSAQALQRPDAPLGTLIFRAGLVPADQLEDALEEGVKRGRRLGEVLLERGLIQESDLARILAGQKGLPYVDPQAEQIDHETAQLLSEEKARLYRALPIRLEDGVPLVAISDPTNEVVIREISATLGRDARFAVASKSALAEAITAVYGSAPVPNGTHPEIEGLRLAAPAPTQAVEPEPDLIFAPHIGSSQPEEPVEVSSPEPVVAAQPAPEPVLAAPPAPEPVFETQAAPEPIADVQPAAEAAAQVQPAPAPIIEAQPSPEPIFEAQPEAQPAAAAVQALEPEAPLAVLQPEPAAVATVQTVSPEPAVEAPSTDPGVVSVPAPALEPEPEAEPAPTFFVPAAEPAPVLVEPAPPVAFEPAQEPAPEPAVAPEAAAAQTEPGTVQVLVRLSNGDQVEIAAAAHREAAVEIARAFIRQLAEKEEGDWPLVGGRFLKPDAIVSIDVLDQPSS